ncbi:porin family protein [Pedobacter sp. GSP4]|uniref:porin family protein n=1 Tax=Pedobacter sp. GSP4 TaxID=3453716 RepID=UPI003EEE0A55
MNHLFKAGASATALQLKKKLWQQFSIAAFLIVFSHAAFAQTKIGIRAGANFAKVSVRDEAGKKQETDYVPGFQIGLTVDVPLVEDVYLQPGFAYALKGFKNNNGGYYGYGENFKAKADYIELPINILYKPTVGKGKLLLGAGPYLAYGTGGSWNSATSAVIGDINIGNTGEIIFRNDAAEGHNLNSYTYGRPLDYGINVLTGYEFAGRFSIQLEGQLGLANLVPDFGDYKPSGKLKNNAFGISLGYKF